MKLQVLFAALLLAVAAAEHQRQGALASTSVAAARQRRHRRVSAGFAADSVHRASPGKRCRGGNVKHEMSAPVLVLNLIADLCPHGMLMLAYGMGAEGGTGAFPSTMLVAVFGALAVYTMWSLGRAAQETGEYTVMGVWEKLVGPRTAPLAEAVVTSLCFGCCLFYAAFIGDLFFSLSQHAGLGFKRHQLLTLLGIVPLLPLCLMRNLSFLGYSSVVGLAGILFTVGFTMKRSLDGTYMRGTEFWNALDERYRPGLGSIARPNLDKLGNLFRVGPGTVTLMNMVCIAFMAHYNGMKYYDELESRTPKRYAYTMATGMSIIVAIFTAFMIFGHATFGAHSQALILNNYATSDSLAVMARLGTGFAILSGFPLMFYALKMSADVLLRKSGFLMTPGRLDVVSTLLLSLIMAVATQTSEETLGGLIGLIGAILGSTLGYIIPAVINLGVARQMSRRDAARRRAVFSGRVRGFKQGSMGTTMGFAEVAFNHVLILFGVGFAVLGTYIELKEWGHH